MPTCLREPHVLEPKLVLAATDASGICRLRKSWMPSFVSILWWHRPQCKSVIEGFRKGRLSRGKDRSKAMAIASGRVPKGLRL
mmetsp:Transcript_2644/g.4508  ORF Transcript_2644/g.4508 Transcript_2644/m.4508 type:complete len:83 (+) Transcript_2644:116-364(+)